MVTRSARFGLFYTSVDVLGACTHAICVIVIAAILGAPAAALAASKGGSAATMRLAGHTLPALAQASKATETTTAASQPLTLTIVLKRDDEAGFQQYLHDVYDPASPIFRTFLSQAQIAERFGPSQQAYDQVSAYLGAQNLALIEGSANRMTLTVSTTRADAERAFAVTIGDYSAGGKTFFANQDDPILPSDIAEHVSAVSGLSNLAQPQPSREAILKAFCASIAVEQSLFTYGGVDAGSIGQRLAQKNYRNCVSSGGKAPIYQQLPLKDPPPPAWQGADGTGQTIGLLEFDSFNVSDISDYLNLTGLPSTLLSNISQVHVNGGAGAQPGANEDEVVLDIDDVISLASGAHIVIYDGPFSGGGASFQAMFNAMVNGGVNVISNSWSYCEDQTTLADVRSIDSILQNAAASGISVFNGSGDSGSSCLDGSANTIGVPADSPSATAVGGTTLNAGTGFTYGTETWWNGTAASPATGQGGFGVSRFFSRPVYQNGLTSATTRSIPDVVANADPATGVMICAADLGGCPTGLFYGGTSSSTPQWAAFAALLNQAQGQNLGAFNLLLYPLAGTSAFHTPASLGSDFAHTGLGSPRLALLHQSLTHQTAGIASASVSLVQAYGESDFTIPLDVALPLPVAADGTSAAHVVVRLSDANGNIVSGKTVTLGASSGSHATITPTSGVSNQDNGSVVFTITDAVVENSTFTAKDTTDGVTLALTASVGFSPPPAAAGSVVAFTDAAPADGTSTDTITVALQDARGLPSPGKLVTLQQNGNSVIAGPSPGVTNASGQIVFTVTDTVQETVTYTATDVTDGNLPVPGSAVVTFSAGGGDNCGITNLGNPAIGAGSGYTITPFATGFVPLVTNFGGLQDGCRGASGLAFDATGRLYVSDAHSGNIYRFATTGGVAGAGTLVTPTPLGPGVESLTFGADGKLYAAINATTGNFFTGAVIEINPTTGALVRTVAASITCASFVATDPASGDVFVNDSCAGNGSENGSIWRIANPGSASPVTTVYATTPGVNGGLTFAPGGTLYMLSYRDNAGAGGVVKITGTGSASPGQVSVLPGITGPALGIAALGQQSNGDALSVILAAAPGSDGFPPGIRSYDTTTNPLSATSLLMQNGFGNVQVIGPDGCMYVSMSVAVYRVANADGTCPLKTDTPLLALTPPSVSPNPAQGSSQSFTATFHNTTVPAGTPVTFQISGANPQIKLARTNASGQASLSYAGINAGIDTVVASATLGNSTTVTSNPARVTWNQGPHTTFLSLNNNPSSASAGKPIALVASVADVSVNPATAIAGVTIQFTVDGQSCSGATNASGVATCNVTLPAIGAFTLNVSFAGTAGYLPATASQILSTLDLIFADGFEGAQP